MIFNNRSALVSIALLALLLISSVIYNRCCIFDDNIKNEPFEICNSKFLSKAYLNKLNFIISEKDHSSEIYSCFDKFKIKISDRVFNDSLSLHLYTDDNIKPMYIFIGISVNSKIDSFFQKLINFDPDSLSLLQNRFTDQKGYIKSIEVMKYNSTIWITKTKIYNSNKFIRADYNFRKNKWEHEKSFISKIKVRYISICNNFFNTILS